MVRPLGTKNIMRTPEEKEKIILEYLNSKQSLSGISSKYNIYVSNLRRWTRNYKEKGIEGLQSKTGKHHKQNLGKYNRHPSEEERLKREITKLEIENSRLKKGYLVKGVGAKKEYVTTLEKNTK